MIRLQSYVEEEDVSERQEINSCKKDFAEKHFTKRNHQGNFELYYCMFQY